MIFSWQNMIYQSTPEAISHLNSGKRIIYAGTDPTAPHLHPGHSILFMFLKALQQANHEVIFLLGGITTRIGDPTGRNETRKILSKEIIDQNTKTIIETIRATLGDDICIVNNQDWLESITLPELLTNYLPKFSLNKMIKNTTFAQRLNANIGLSLQEIMYPVLQGIDFAILNETKNCTVQVGGSDQWNNIVSGLNIKNNLHGITIPLLTDSQGKKLSKSHFQDISIHPSEDPWKVWQFFFNLDDQITQMLKNFMGYKIEDLFELKTKIATDFTELHFGKLQAENAKEQSRQIFQEKNLDFLPIIYINSNLKLFEILVVNKLAKSNSIARHLIRTNAVKVNNQIVTDEMLQISMTSTIMIGKKGVRVEIKKIIG